MFTSLKAAANGAALSYISNSSNRHNSFSCRAAASASVAVGRSNAMKESNLYKLLSLESEKVGFDEIKKAYRSKALRYHPDVCPSSDSTDMFVELHRAYATLSDPTSRRAYDTELRDGGPDGVTVARAGRFRKETWEAQLHGLLRRSESRQGQTEREIRG